MCRHLWGKLHTGLSQLLLAFEQSSIQELDIGENHDFCPPHLHSTPPLGGPHRNISITCSTYKPEWCGYPMVKNVVRYVYSFQQSPRSAALSKIWCAAGTCHFSADEEMHFQASCKGGRRQYRQTQFSEHAARLAEPRALLARLLWTAYYYYDVCYCLLIRSRMVLLVWRLELHWLPPR